MKAAAATPIGQRRCGGAAPRGAAPAALRRAALPALAPGARRAAAAAPWPRGRPGGGVATR
jgi:hypothetical protein